MALSQGLYQKQLQKLSPQQIQLMKLLQVPTALLEERIKEEMEENPALEEAEEGHEEEYQEAKDEFEEFAYWSNTEDSSESGWAWYQNFCYGHQYSDFQTSGLRARAVRRLII